MAVSDEFVDYVIDQLAATASWPIRVSNLLNSRFVIAMET